MYLAPWGECARVLSASISTALIKKVMDKISDENPSQSEIIGCCGRDEETG